MTLRCAVWAALVWCLLAGWATPAAEAATKKAPAKQVEHAASIILAADPAWPRRDFERKLHALQDLASRGKLVRATTPVSRDPSVTADYKNRLIRAAYDTYGKKDPATFQRMRTRILSMQPEHVHDLQLGGLDDASNLSLLNADVNQGLGRQVWQQIRDLPPGTKITSVKERR